MTNNQIARITEAYKLIVNDDGWEDCSKGTGDECKGLDCHVPCHVAAMMLAGLLYMKRGK
jgi:hypothetical protein